MAARSDSSRNPLVLSFLEGASFTDRLRILEGLLQREDPDIQPLIAGVLTDGGIPDPERRFWMRKLFLGLSEMEQDRHDRWIEANRPILQETFRLTLDSREEILYGALHGAMQRELPALFPGESGGWTAFLAQKYLRHWRREKRLAQGNEILWADAFLEVMDQYYSEDPVLTLLHRQVEQYLGRR